MKQALTEAAMTMPVAKAREKVAEYLKAVRERHHREDMAILAGYKALAKGHPLIDLPHVIGLGGVFENGLPRLAVATTSHEFVNVRRQADGSVRFMPAADPPSTRKKDVYVMPVSTLPEMTRPESRYFWEHPWNGRMRAMVPHLPPSLRPARARTLDTYTTLFEVQDWKIDPTAPSDPALLKHVGGDLYAVLATWDLSPLEQSVLNGRTR